MSGGSGGGSGGGDGGMVAAAVHWGAEKNNAREIFMGRLYGGQPYINMCRYSRLHIFQYTGLYVYFWVAFIAFKHFTQLPLLRQILLRYIIFVA